MVVHISTKFGQNWFSSLGAMACDERVYGQTDGRTDGRTDIRTDRQHGLVFCN